MSAPTELPPGALLPEDAASWRRVRRYAVPGWMIERATAHRLAGDWRAACAAAAVEVAFDLPALASRYGPAVAGAAEDDLRHLVPDLLRWHLPRVLGGRTTLAPNRRVLLAHYGPGRGGDVPALYLTTRAMVDGPQRLRLHCAPVDPAKRRHAYAGWTTEDWTAARWFWDSRHTAALRSCAGPADRLPFFRADGTPLAAGELPSADPGAGDPAGRAEWAAVLQQRGDVVEAFAAAGIELDLTPPEDRWGAYRGQDPRAVLSAFPMDLARLVDTIRLLTAAGAGDRYCFSPDWRGGLLLEPGGSGTAGALRARLAVRDDLNTVTRVPLYAWQPLPDPYLVRTGRITPRELHPLVSAALFPGAGPAVGPPGPAAPRPVRVRCLGEWHEVRSRDGVLEMPHSAGEQQRERAMRAFGGAVAGCFAARDAWTSGQGRLPRALRGERRELFQRALHGDAPGVLALLDAGLDPRVRDARGQGLLHLLPFLPHEELLPRLLAAGLGLEDEDQSRRTPLQSAVQNGGTAALVRALLAAGARTDGIDDMDLSLAQVIRRYKRDDLAFLRELVEERHPGIGSESYEDFMDEREEWGDDDEDYDDDGYAAVGDAAVGDAAVGDDGGAHE
ncbi:ankyrin repeat domain-containing protein [Streptomyces sp. NBC_00091]|uniref:ankyrin repeat domain-containing protein n=1 Tax=Streptomyces sp. NBC_00091 TaxID=2975648 RepID=UPI00225A0E62|nr:ankyrin repeat domain-containing protein [Streptomyces sp. NBC_00091]MCX5380766.1 ankyrin repeat domain-containing protein [Streptomyces sp. NBC_00091]